jgi:ubiquinone/menaquinone biosynthesis C-methylase UbiE
VSPERFATAFAKAAGEYERGRPSYPAAALDRLAEELGLDRGSTVVDLAAGTGKLTRDLVPRFARVVAVEPLDEMRAELVRRLPDVEALGGSAEELPLADASADAVLVAQAFHWFDGRRALREIARALRPGGGLGLLWNSSPWETREGTWFAALDDLLEERRVDLATMRRHGSGLWVQAFAGEERFGPLAHATFENQQRLRREDFIAALASRSYIAVLEERHRAEVLAAIDAMLERDDAPLEGGDVVLPLTTEVYWTRLGDG